MGWDELAIKGFEEIVENQRGIFTSQTINLMIGLQTVLSQGSLLAYLVSMTLRVAEIHRVLKPTGSFYFHCDSTSSHYLKIILDSIFCSQGGNHLNEIIWKRASTVKGNFGQGSKKLGANTDSIFFYCKTQGKNLFNFPFVGYKEDYIQKFYRYVEPDGRRYRLISMIGPGGAAKGNPTYEVMGVTRYWRYSKEKMQELIDSGLVVQTNPGNVPVKKQYLDDGGGSAVQSLWDDVEALSPSAKERLGYPTQKPEALLERVIEMSSNEGSVILDAYCGCGTTVAVAEKLNRKWIGIDITYQSISLILKRLEDSYGKEAVFNVEMTGIPKDMKSAEALANKQDDRTRKEFEKWAILTFSNNRASINHKKGADKGIDGTAFFLESEGGHGRIIFQVKSGKVDSRDIRDLVGTMTREKAALGVFITLKKPTKDMTQEAKTCGLYHHQIMGCSYPKVAIVTVQDIIENGLRLHVPLSLEVLKSAQRKHQEDNQLVIFSSAINEAV